MLTVSLPRHDRLKSVALLPLDADVIVFLYKTLIPELVLRIRGPGEDKPEAGSCFFPISRCMVQYSGQGKEHAVCSIRYMPPRSRYS